SSVHFDLQNASPDHLQQLALLPLQLLDALEVSIKQLQTENQRLRQHSVSNKLPSFVKPTPPNLHISLVTSAPKLSPAPLIRSLVGFTTPSTDAHFALSP